MPESETGETWSTLEHSVLFYFPNSAFHTQHDVEDMKNDHNSLASLSVHSENRRQRTHQGPINVSVRFHVGLDRGQFSESLAERCDIGKSVDNRSIKEDVPVEILE